MSQEQHSEKRALTRAERQKRMLRRQLAGGEATAGAPAPDPAAQSTAKAQGAPLSDPIRTGDGRSTAEARRARRRRIAQRAAMERAISELDGAGENRAADSPESSAEIVGRGDALLGTAQRRGAGWTGRRLSESLKGLRRGYAEGRALPRGQGGYRARAVRRTARSRAAKEASTRPVTLAQRVAGLLRPASSAPSARAVSRASRKPRRHALVACALGMSLLAAPLLMAMPFVSIASSVVTAAERQNGAALGPVEMQVASFLLGKGLDPVQVAAIMGNMKAESGMDPTSMEANGSGIGLCQWSHGRAQALKDYAASLDRDWREPDVQLDFFWEHDIFQDDWSGSYRVSGGYDDPSPAPGTRVHGSRPGFMAATTVRDATEQFCYGWEKPGFPRIDRRVAFAESFYAALASGGGRDYADANARQRAVADAARSGTYGTRTGWCQAWVCKVYGAAGESRDSRCCAHAAGEAWVVSTSMEDIPVGATVYVGRSASGTRCGCGRDAGHVGIYIGAGQVASRRGGDAPWIETIQQFADNYGHGGWMGWGWNGGVPLTTPDAE